MGLKSGGSLAALPRELRDYIYALMLGSGQFHLAMFHWELVDTDSYPITRADMFRMPDLVDQEGVVVEKCNDKYAILQVSRLIHEEAMEILFRQGAFVY